MRSSDDDVVGPPGELLDVGAVVGKGHGAAVVADILVQHVRNRLEVLKCIKVYF